MARKKPTAKAAAPKSAAPKPAPAPKAAAPRRPARRAAGPAAPPPPQPPADIDAAQVTDLYADGAFGVHYEGGAVCIDLYRFVGRREAGGGVRSTREFHARLRLPASHLAGMAALFADIDQRIRAAQTSGTAEDSR